MERGSLSFPLGWGLRYPRRKPTLRVACTSLHRQVTYSVVEYCISLISSPPRIVPARLHSHTLATRLTWTTQIACLAGLYSVTVVPCICAVQRNQSCAFRRCTRNWSTRRTRLKLIESALVLFPPLVLYPRVSTV